MGRVCLIRLVCLETGNVTARQRFGVDCGPGSPHRRGGCCTVLHPQSTLDIELQLTCSDAHTERQGPELSSTRVQRLEPGRVDHVFPNDRRLCVPERILTLLFLALGFTYLTSI